MLVLKENETCPHSLRCPYAGNGATRCQGTNPNRDQKFTCEFVKPDGRICDGHIRNSMDVTGKMKILVD